jgi:hypothetical protein
MGQLSAMAGRAVVLIGFDRSRQPIELTDVENRRPEDLLTDCHASKPSRDLRQFPEPKVPGG